MCYLHKPAIKHISANLLPWWDPGSVDLLAPRLPQSCHRCSVGPELSSVERMGGHQWTCQFWCPLTAFSHSAQLGCCLLGVISHILVLVTGLTTLFGAVHLSLSYDRSSPPHSLDCVRTAACIYVPSWRSCLTWEPCLGAGTNNGKLKIQRQSLLLSNNRNHNISTFILFS